MRVAELKSPAGPKVMRLAVLVLTGLLLQGCSQDDPRPASAEATYQRYCFSCHTTGAGGAPRTGDVETWRPRLAQGRDVLIRHTIDGLPPAMPARGLCRQCSDEELVQVVDYMIERSQ